MTTFIEVEPGTTISGQDFPDRVVIIVWQPDAAPATVADAELLRLWKKIRKSYRNRLVKPEPAGVPTVYISGCRFAKGVNVVTNNGCHVHVVFVGNTIVGGKVKL